jgi:hemerythrin-like domain-containing protein
VSSFVELLSLHEALSQFFLLHQEAVLAADVPRAIERLDSYERYLRQHMQEEEVLLLPVYERAGRIPGGAPEFFTGEHRKMLELLKQIRRMLTELAASAQPRDIIHVLDEEARYKSLVEHHDQREQNILYPTLDRITTEMERAALLKQCSTDIPRV